MDITELDMAISELETRLERLRSLYEQYFLGFEKVPPQVARKDVDRRIWELRRVKIRNTAKRFKLQTVIQRYNTFQQYWQRILREIEHGTYKRHVLRAERATVRTREETTAADAAHRSVAEPVSHDDMGRLLDSETDLDMELDRALAEASALTRPPTEDTAAGRAAAAPGGAQASSGPLIPQRVVRSEAPVARRAVETLDLDMDGFDSAPLRPSLNAPSASAARSHEPTANSPAAAGGVGARPAATPTVARAKPDAPPARAAGHSAGARVARANLGAPAARPGTPGGAERVNPLAALGKKEPSPAPGQGPSATPRKAEPRALRKAAPARGSPSAGRAKPGASKGLSDQRIAELHNRLLEVKRQTKEGGQVSVRGLAKSLRAAETKLRKQHKDRRIDFDIVIKNGRAVVKPVVR